MPLGARGVETTCTRTACVPDSVFVDTNVFVYALDADEPSKRAIALELLSTPTQAFVTSAQVLAEL